MPVDNSLPCTACGFDWDDHEFPDDAPLGIHGVPLAKDVRPGDVRCPSGWDRLRR